MLYKSKKNSILFNFLYPFKKNYKHSSFDALFISIFLQMYQQNQRDLITVQVTNQFTKFSYNKVIIYKYISLPDESYTKIIVLF